MCMQTRSGAVQSRTGLKGNASSAACLENLPRQTRPLACGSKRSDRLLRAGRLPRLGDRPNSLMPCRVMLSRSSCRCRDTSCWEAGHTSQKDQQQAWQGRLLNMSGAHYLRSAGLPAHSRVVGQPHLQVLQCQLGSSKLPAAGPALQVECKLPQLRAQAPKACQRRLGTLACSSLLNGRFVGQLHGPGLLGGYTAAQRTGAAAAHTVRGSAATCLLPARRSIARGGLPAAARLPPPGAGTPGWQRSWRAPRQAPVPGPQACMATSRREDEQAVPLSFAAVSWKLARRAPASSTGQVPAGLPAPAAQRPTCTGQGSSSAGLSAV